MSHSSSKSNSRQEAGWELFQLQSASELIPSITRKGKLPACLAVGQGFPHPPATSLTHLQGQVGAGHGIEDISSVNVQSLLQLYWWLATEFNELLQLVSSSSTSWHATSSLPPSLPFDSLPFPHTAMHTAWCFHSVKNICLGLRKAYQEFYGILKQVCMHTQNMKTSSVFKCFCRELFSWKLTITPAIKDELQKESNWHFEPGVDEVHERAQPCQCNCIHTEGLKAWLCWSEISCLQPRQTQLCQ